MEVSSMNNLPDMIWIELRKAIRSRMPLWTAIGSLFMPLGIAFLIFIAKNPAISQQLGLVGAKANLMSYASTDWPTYLGLYGQLIGAGGIILFILVISWVFGREFADSTLKDLLAVPVGRSSILLAKYIVSSAWFVVLTVEIFSAGLLMGAIINLPGGSSEVILHGSAVLAVTALLVIPVVLPFALFACAGRGYLLPIGLAILTMMATNIAIIAGWGDYFPWAIPGLYVQGKSPLPTASYWIVVFTGLAGMLATYLWWKLADQSR
jgi:ABC-type transport system involved in multi-copper enzyme maturation permease subunit